MTADRPTHDAANIFPLEEETIPALAADIRANGQLVPIELLGGAVLDGRRRLRACELAGVEPRFVEVSPADPVAHVLSLNLHRRHLTVSQVAMVGARARAVQDAAAKERQKAALARGNKSRIGQQLPIVETFPQSAGAARDQVGRMVGVSGVTIDRATRVLKEAVPELVKAVDDGRVTVNRAAGLVEESPEVQRAAAAAKKPEKQSKAAPVPPQQATNEPPASGGKLLGVGVFLANDAINCLSRIPKDDGLRAAGFKIVADWLRRNK